MKKYIGNIIVNNPNYKIDNCFNKCLNTTTIDKSLPTLIIGLQNAKDNIKDFNIIHREYENKMLWWTFSKTERRNDYNKDIQDFMSFCINKIINSIDYYFINYVNLTYNKAKKCLLYIKNNRKKYYFIDKNKFIFVYDTEMKKIYGFSLNTCFFFDISKEKVISLIENNTNNIKIKNFYAIPNNIRKIINDDIPSEMVLLEYF